MTPEMIPGLINFVVFCLLACATMAFVAGMVRMKTFKTAFIIMVSSMIVGSIIGCFASPFLMPDEPEVWRLGMFLLGPAIGFCAGGFICLLGKPLPDSTEEKD